MKLIVAVSGGPDSQALLHWLTRRGNTVIAVGIDHGLRPEAGKELDLAEDLARALDVPFIRQKVTLAKGNVLNEARKARYAALSSVADKHDADYIATGHTASDQLETILLQLMRSDGVTTAKGMSARSGRIIRPILGWSRDDVLAYLEANAIAYATDPSNSNIQRSRARLRAEVVPILKALQPSIERTIGTYAEARQNDERLLTRAARNYLTTPERPLGSVATPLVKATLAAAPIPLRRRALKLWLRDVNLTPTRRLIDRLEHALARTQARIPASQATFHVDETLLWVVPHQSYDIALPVPGEASVPNSRLRIAARLDPAPLGGYGAVLTLAPTKVALDADDLQFELRLRGWRPGDRIVPFGRGGGSVKIGDLFTNTKVPRAMRPGWPVVVCGSEIVWVVGLRRGKTAPITPRTSRVVTLEVLG